MNIPPARALGIGRTLVPLGTHLLAVYMSEFVKDLAVIRYLQAGLVAGEAGLWITASDKPGEYLRRTAGRVGSPIAPFVDTPMLTVASFRDWYYPSGHVEAQRIAEQWAEQVDAARRQGFTGLRAFCEITWTTERERDDLIAYEAGVGCTLKPLPIIATCAYAGELVRGEPMERLLRGHDHVLKVSESPITFYFGDHVPPAPHVSAAREAL